MSMPALFFLGAILIISILVMFDTQTRPRIFPKNLGIYYLDKSRKKMKPVKNKEVEKEETPEEEDEEEPKKKRRELPATK